MIPVAYAHIPGQNARHPDEAFDCLKDELAPDSRLEDIQKSKCFKTALECYEAGYYWEAHECMEEVWNCCSENSAEKLQIQAFIQLANGKLKQKMARHGAAERLRKVATDLWEESERRDARLLTGSIAEKIRKELIDFAL